MFSGEIGKPVVSVVICTYNRAQSLHRTLESLAAMSLPPDFSWELVVVDNNSTDQTPKVVADFAAAHAFDVRYVFEKNQGLSHARNRGIVEATGDILAFVDDDIVVTSNWLASIARGFSDLNADCIGGKILPLWEGPVPTWLTQDLYGYLGLLDHGDAPIRMTTPDLWGANYAVRRSLFSKYGQFNVTLGRTPDKLYAGEETDFSRRLLQGGAHLWYCAQAVVYHRVPAARMTKSYLRKWTYDQGELRGSLARDTHRKQIAGLPLYPFLNLWETIRHYVLGVLRREPGCFGRELHIYGAIGFLRGRLLRCFGKT